MRRLFSAPSPARSASPSSSPRPRPAGRGRGFAGMPGTLLSRDCPFVVEDVDGDTCAIAATRVFPVAEILWARFDVSDVLSVTLPVQVLYARHAPLGAGAVVRVRLLTSEVTTEPAVLLESLWAIMCASAGRELSSEPRWIVTGGSVTPCPHES